MGRRVRSMVLLGLALLGLAGTARAEQEARLLEATALGQGQAVVCRLRTAGLPTDKQLQSMRSGLVSAVDLELAVMDARGDLGAGRSLTLRLAFDLWEQFFSVRSGDQEQRFQDLEALRAYLGELNTLTVASRAELQERESYHLRVGLTVHAIAPDERARVEDVVAGERRNRREGDDTQEASVGLGRLIRFFYKDGRDRSDGLEIQSGWFTLEELPDAPH